MKQNYCFHLPNASFVNFNDLNLVNICVSLKDEIYWRTAFWHNW
jgi:hypothetical protein